MSIANSERPNPEHIAYERIDLRGVPCPLSFVKAKLRLERIQSGQLLELWLDQGEPVEQVPNSLSVDGHKILSLIEHEDKFFTLLVEKV
jgi:tRNA 2-thiouridine synthesizing protein A